MLTLIRKLFDKILFDDKAVARWLRGTLLGFAGTGLAFSEQLAAVLPGSVAAEKIKVAAVVAGFVAGMVTAGDKNPKA